MASSVVQLEPGVAESILRWSAAAHPLEACGLLAGTAGLVCRATLARNIATEPWHRFEIDPGHLLAEQRRTREDGHALLGAWHSHPNGIPEPSAADSAGHCWPGLWMMIAAAGRLALFAPAPGGWMRMAIAPHSPDG
jgi:proteasome lid subunit RPN8/RPN11